MIAMASSTPSPSQSTCSQTVSAASSSSPNGTLLDRQVLSMEGRRSPAGARGLTTAGSGGLLLDRQAERAVGKPMSAEPRRTEKTSMSVAPLTQS